MALQAKKSTVPRLSTSQATTEHAPRACPSPPPGATPPHWTEEDTGVRAHVPCADCTLPRTCFVGSPEVSRVRKMNPVLRHPQREGLGHTRAAVLPLNHAGNSFCPNKASLYSFSPTLSRVPIVNVLAWSHLRHLVCLQQSVTEDSRSERQTGRAGGEVTCREEPWLRRVLLLLSSASEQLGVGRPGCAGAGRKTSQQQGL